MSTAASTSIVPAGVLAGVLRKFKSIVPKPNRHNRARDAIMIGQTAGRGLRLRAGDDDLALQVEADADSDGLSSLLVGCSGLMSAAAAFTSERIHLRLADHLTLRGETSGITLECQASGDAGGYPALTEAAESEPLVFPAGELLGALRALSPCMAAGGNHYATQHIHFANREQGGVELAATDGQRLAVYAFPGVSRHVPEASPSLMRTPEAEAETQHLPGLHRGAVSWLLRHAERSGDVRIGFDRGRAGIAGNGWTLRCRLCDSAFPRYRELLDSLPGMPGRLVVRRRELLDILGKIGAVEDAAKTVTLAADNNGEAAAISAKAGERTVFTASIPAASRKFPDFSANREFLSDMAAALPGELIVLRFASHGGNDLILAREERLTYALMPIGGIDTNNPAYLAALAGPDQDYPGAATPA